MKSISCDRSCGERHGRATPTAGVDVLAYLLRHRDRIVSKQELFESVWQRRIVSDAALNSRISAARRAIDDDGNTQALIRTAHKRAFCFVGDVHVDHAEPTAEAKGASPEGNVSQDTPTLAPAAEPAEPLPLPNKPSIAVLPFQNMTGDPE